MNKSEVSVGSFLNSQIEHQEKHYEVYSKFDEGLFLKTEQQAPVSNLSGVIQPHTTFRPCYISIYMMGERDPT